VKDLRQRLNERPSFGEVSEQNVGVEAADYEDLVIKLNAEFAVDDTVAMRAAKLLYYIVKDRPFLEGNKRIGALLFIVYLTQNDFSLTKNNETKISDRALTALVLLIAESESSEKELILKLITKLLDD
jgi:prophage maintenance system killer protein